ncbi:MAG TPA: PQQ-dependent sugar dehydrogenase [Polyangia bacterium]
MALASLLPGARRTDAKEAAAAAPQPPFADYRGQVPGTSHLIRVADLPAPDPARSIDNGPHLVKRPKNAWPQAPAGFKVDLYAEGLSNPRLIRVAPNGDAFIAESKNDTIRVLRGVTADGKAAQSDTYARGLNEPFGIAFYPSGPGVEPRWLYVANTGSVVRFPYRSGDVHARTAPQVVVPDLPGGGLLRGGGHWTRDLAFSRGDKKLFVSVGSHSNVDDPDTTKAEFHRADILEFKLDGSGLLDGGSPRVFASGIRNAVGIAIHPRTGALWASVNERDLLGDNLVPDYITTVADGGFYGWPWFYIGGHPDPRHAGKHPELRAKVIVPDVLLQPHFASLEMCFYEATQFPAAYHGDIFAAEHGSWNRHVRTGYEVIRVPLHGQDRASGAYEDFLTGFVTENGDVWGRPVGVAVAKDGALLVTDDGGDSVWRVTSVQKWP